MATWVVAWQRYKIASSDNWPLKSNLSTTSSISDREEYNKKRKKEKTWKTHNKINTYRHNRVGQAAGVGSDSHEKPARLLSTRCDVDAGKPAKRVVPCSTSVSPPCLTGSPKGGGDVIPRATPTTCSVSRTFSS